MYGVAWHSFLADLRDRGLASPLLVVSDGAPGLIGAIQQAYPQALRQRCLIHRCRKLLAKIPAGMQAEVKDAYRAVFDTEDLKTPPGLTAYLRFPAEHHHRIRHSNFT